MEFIVDETGCRNLAENMRQHLAAIRARVDAIAQQDRTLHAALGSDYEAIGRTARTMSEELEAAQRNMDITIRNMEEYISRVGQIRISLNG